MGKETISRTTFAKGVTAGVIAAASLGILTVGEYAIDVNTSGESASSAVSSESTAATDTGSAGIAAADLSACTPGTYTASAKGISSDVTVTVTIDETGIADITADVSGETAGLGADIGDEMIDKALSAQSADIDSVSGVTITSDAFKAALSDCIAQASGGAVSEETEAAEADESEEATAAEEDESEEATAVADKSEEETTAETESEEETTAADESEEETTAADESEEETTAADESKEETTAESESEEETTAETDTVEASADASEAGATGQEFTPGAYGASAAGISSDVKVIAVFDESNITSLYTDVSGETPDIGGVIGDEMIEKALNAQSADIDGVSGATITSDAFKSALSNCIAMASGEAFIKETAAEGDDIEASTETGAANQGFIPGAYSASAAGISSDVEVIAVFDETSITSLYTDVSGETPDIGGVIGEEMIEKALNAQSADIDGVSGATITSDAFKSALSSCITMASSDGPVSTFAAGKSDDPAESPEGSFVPGTYTATAAGIDSDVTVTMTFDEASIMDIEVDVSGETAGIGAIIGDDITAQILAAQSADVDGVSGATITSDAVKTAVADCISQAKAGNASGAETESEAETEAN